MVDPAVQRLLDTVFNAAPGAGPPDIAQLRVGALQAAQLLGGEPEALASLRDTRITTTHGTIPLRIYRPASPSKSVLCRARRR